MEVRNVCDELKHGKLYGAAFLLSIYIFPLGMNLFLESRTHVIKAILKSNVQYEDLSGITHVVMAGALVTVQPVDPMSSFTDIHGKLGLHNDSGFVMAVGEELVDIERSEFKTID